MTALWVALAFGALVGLAFLLWALLRVRTPPTEGVDPELRRIYTTHARQRMEQRAISKEQVESALLRPDRIDRDDREDSMRFERDLEGMLLKVWVAADPWPPVDQVVVKTTAARHFGSLSIPPKAVGRVIGRGGATIQRVEDVTKAKITVERDGAVHLRADDRASVEHARRMINEIATTAQTIPGFKRPS